MIDSNSYTVKLPLFEGPLDLLLHLIQKDELDITAISLARVADQFVAYLASLREVRAEVITDFLEVAARLLLIKSRWLLPKPPSSEEDEEDPGEVLARRLREYKLFKEASGRLRLMEEAGRTLHIRVAPPPVLESRLDLESLSLDELVAAFQQLLLIEPESQPVAPIVSARKVTVREKIEHIHELFRVGRPVTFDDVLAGGTSRVDIIVSLWAVLELIKRGHLRARQSELFGEILLEPSPQAVLELA